MTAKQLKKGDRFMFTEHEGFFNGPFIFEEIYMGNTLVQHPFGKQHGTLTFKGTPKVKLVKDKK